MSRESDEMMMRRALQLAALGRGFASPNPMVGAVIVNPQGLIAGSGWHRCCGQAHAEVNAVEDARRRISDFRDCTIYVTLEPCAHYGKTPPCARLLVECGFRRVVIGCVDPFEKVAGRGISLLREAGIEVETGVLEQECRELNRRFFFAHTHRRPWVLLKWAQSADGFIAAQGGRSVRFSTPAGSLLMHRERAGVDAIMAGTGTLLADNPQLSVRLWPHRSLRPVVIESPRLNREVRLLSDPRAIPVPRLPLPELLDRLYGEHGITSLMVEGGAAMLSSFLRGNLWQEMRVEVSPLMLHEGIEAPAVELRNLRARAIGSNIIYTKTNVSTHVKNT